MEVIGNTIIHMIKGSLPWTKFVGSPSLTDTVTNTSLEKLCQYCPKEMLQYMKYCRNLDFTEEPDYDHLVSLFQSAYDNSETEGGLK